MRTPSDAAGRIVVPESPRDGPVSAACDPADFASPPASGACGRLREREILSPVDLCLPNGRLNPDAVGWSRRPLQRANLRGRRLAKKRWNYWAVTSPTHLFSATVSDLDYAGVVFVYLGDLERGELVEGTVLTALGRGCTLPETVDGSVAFRGRSLTVRFEREPAGVRIEVRARNLGGAPLVAEIAVALPAGHESLSVVVPWDERTFQLTTKRVALPAAGRVRHGEREIRFAPDDSFACLDFGRGIWPRRCAWNWGTAAGRVGGRTIGLNLGGKWTDGTGATENALLVDGHLWKLSQELAWDYDRTSFLRPWHVATPSTGEVDLLFKPCLERIARSGFWPISSEVHQLFGRWRGSVLAGDGARIEIRDLLGWAEEHVARW